ncbi:MAG: PAS domain-containing protein [Deltaproteobacteria bacterium]|nr:PAS domain-containing protein [Deltaproteobacteria bacterium]
MTISQPNNENTHSLFDTAIASRSNQWSADYSELQRRLPWLLVFRVIAATILLALAIFVDWRNLPLGSISNILYAVILGNYFIVLVLGLLLRWRIPLVAVAGGYLAMSLGSALVVVQATGVIDSTFTFLYLLVVLDAAVIGGRALAIAIAATCAVAYGVQLVMQMYNIFPADRIIELPDWSFAGSGIANLSAFYLTAFLAGYLAELWRSARSEASRAFADLESARIFHSAIINALPVGVLVIDEQQRIYAANPRAFEIFKSTSDLIDSILPQSIPIIQQPIGKFVELSTEIDGNKRVLGLIRSKPLNQLNKDEKSDKTIVNRPKLEILVIEDRTELKQLELRLSAKEKLASLGELAAAIAHEIRNPLAAISGSIELLMSNDTDAPAATSLHDIITREISRLEQLIQDFLQFARPAPVECTQVNLSALTRDVCNVIKTDNIMSNKKIKVDIPEYLEAKLDPSSIRQVLWNLLRNAAEASATGGLVELSLIKQSMANGVSIVLTIRDYGEGIPEYIRQHLFEPFQTSKQQGTGLGLAVVHRIIEKHNGTIALTNADGGGTIVKVILPQSSNE